MDETSDPHMETDVSSTTEDVPEMQEVTGSNGDVVLIVEKIDEEHMDSSPKSGEKTPQICESSSPSKVQKPQSAPPNTTTPLAPSTTPNKSPMQKIVLKRPSKCILTVDQLKKVVSLNKEETNPVTQSTGLLTEETVDSSSKNEVQNDLVNNDDGIAKKSPLKDVDVEIIIKSTTNAQDKMKASPEKFNKINVESIVNDSHTTQNTIVKEQSNVQKSPVKVYTREKVETQKSPEKKAVETPKDQVEPSESPQQTPVKITKEQIVLRMSPQKTYSKTPPKEQVTPQTSPQKNSVKTPTKQQVILQPSPQKSPVKTPTKEQSEPQKSMQKTPVKTPTKEQEESQKTPVKTIVKETQEVQEVPKISTEVSAEHTKSPAKVVTETEKVNGDRENGEDNKLSNNNNADPKEIVIEKDASNDSQVESLEATEKDHNKSISRELKSLIKSAKESKIISECTQLTSKTRKSRSALDSSNPLNTSVEADKIQGNRRISSNSQKSNCSEKSDKTATKRSMRSQNPEFVNKVKLFLNSVTKTQKDSDDGTDEDMEDVKTKEPPPEVRASTPKKRKPPIIMLETPDKPNKLRTDPYCWRCHWAIEQPANEKIHPPMHCTVCPRSFHFKCLSGVERSKINTEKNWVCPECMSILHAESSETRSPAMKKISLGMLCELLQFALQRMMDLNGVEPFMQPVDRTAFPDYDKYVVHPMDLTLMKDNITAGLYGSTEAFVADAQWILHNSIIFNTNLLSTVQSKLTGGARALVRSCRAEMGEIEACHECYKAAHARRPTWFTDVCTTPHVLLWAKLKGFPYWPAKAMSVNNSGLVDVRFFGAHDRAWVPAKDCFLYSERDPNNFRTKRQDILDSMQEAEQHIRNISRKYGKFVYPPFKTQFEPSKLTEQIKLMIPSFEGEVRAPTKEKSQNSSPSANSNKSRLNCSRSNSKSSKEGQEGETSEVEDASTVATRKMADGAEIAREEEGSADKNKTMEVDESQTSTPAKESEKSRKRRHSQLEEAVITILDTSVKEKKRKIENKGKSDDKTEAEPSTSKVVEKTVEKKSESTQEKTENTPKTKEKDSTEASTDQNTPKVAPIKIITTPKGNKTTIRSSTPKIRLVAKPVKRPSSEKRSSKDEKKSRSSRNKSLNNSNATPGKDKAEKKNDKSVDSSTKAPKDATNIKNKDKEVEEKTTRSKQQNAENKMRDRLQFDDDTSLAVLARKSKDGENDVTGLPTISSVISLSTTAQNTKTTATKTTTPAKSIEVTVEANSSSSIFTLTSKDSANSVKDAADKLQKLRSDTNQSNQSLVGKVGVRAFARMTSPPAPKNKDVEVEIKAEPIDLDDSDRQMEKMEVMNAFHLRPVNQTSSLREVRINKLVVAPLSGKKGGKVVEVRPRAKKSFPQPPRVEGRSELKGNNSMVYIPIQPASTPGPQKGPRPVVPVPASTANVSPVVRPPAPVTTSTSLHKPSPMSTITSTPNPVMSVVSSPGQGPTVGQATVHTVPLITSVNGQWTLALQPVMSVGGIDSDSPLVNGTPERIPTVSGITAINNLSVPGLPNVNNMGSLANVTNVGSLANLNNASSLANSGIVTNVTGIANMASKVTGMTGAVPITAAGVAPSVQGNSRLNDSGSTLGEPPRLQQRPGLVPQDVPPPPSAGPLTARISQSAGKLADFFRTLLEETLEQCEDPQAQVTSLRLQLEQMRWRHQQEIDEIKHNNALTQAEMRSSLEKERLRCVGELRRAAHAELEAAVSLAKSKQWCAMCSQEAQFYCCWNTSYCDYPCQRAHWSQHYAVCTQKRMQDGNTSGDGSSSPPERLQPQPDNVPKNTPKLIAANPGKTRPQQDSIIMSVTEDGRGNQTLKCVGTYKPPSQVVINKQVITNEDNSTKKVVTSGGYLIVGASNSTAVVTQPRRGTIQYY